MDQESLKITLNNLPLELLDIILEISLLQSILNSSPQKQRDEDIIKSLASVDYCWFQRITKMRFTKRIWLRLKAVIKVIVQARGENDLFLDTQLLQQRIKYLQDRMTSSSNQTDELISKLKEVGIELINYGLDRQTVVVWMWCRLQAALEYLHKLYTLNKMTEICEGHARIRPFSSKIIHSILINVDGNHLKKTIVVRSMAVSFAGNLDGEEDEYTTGVTKLLGEIYVLCQTHSYEPTFTRNVIRVFEDRNPFSLRRIIELKEIESDTADIESSEKENCLYVSQPEGNCVWKITRDNNGHETIKWLITDYSPFTLSVSSYGNLLVIGFLPILNIYGSDAKHIRSIQLPEDIMDLRHAIEIATRNFIVLHKWRDQREPESGSKERNSPWVVSELTRNGQMVIRRFSPSDGTQKLNFPTHFAIDSSDGVIVADGQNRRVIRLDVDFEWNQVICPTRERTEKFSSGPKRCCCDKENTQLIVNLERGTNVYTLSRK